MKKNIKEFTDDAVEELGRKPFPQALRKKGTGAGHRHGRIRN